jgi:hypothetical protein
MTFMQQALEVFEAGVAENFVNRHRNEAFVNLFETIAQIIKEIRR